MLRDELFRELDMYVNAEKFETPHIIINVKDLATYKMATESGKEEIKKILENHRVAKGIYNYGFRMFYDPTTMDIKTEDIHIATVQVVAKNNRPKAIVTLNNNITTFICGKAFHRYEGRNADGTVDIRPIKLIMPALELENCFYNMSYYEEGSKEAKKTDYEMIRFTPDSLETFYGFGDTACVKLTPAMVKKYWETSDMTLKRHDVNLSSHSNGWGLTFPVWSDTLVEVYGGTAYISEDILKEEIDIITKGYETSWIAKEMKNKYKAMHNDDENDKDAKKKKMANIVTCIQDVVDKHTEEILDKTLSNLGVATPPVIATASKDIRVQTKRNILASMEERYGLDCGFLYFRFKDTDLHDLAKEVSSYGLSTFSGDGTFTLRIPYDNQSTTIKSNEASVIRDLIKETKLPEITFRTVLD